MGMNIGVPVEFSSGAASIPLFRALQFLVSDERHLGHASFSLGLASAPLVLLVG